MGGGGGAYSEGDSIQIVKSVGSCMGGGVI